MFLNDKNKRQAFICSTDITAGYAPEYWKYSQTKVYNFLLESKKPFLFLKNSFFLFYSIERHF